MRSISEEEIKDLLHFARQQADFILKSTADVRSKQDFLLSMSGMVLFNSTCMCLQSIGEAIRQVDNKTEGKLFSKYPEIPWKQIIGMRNILSHEYLSIDPDLIFDIISQEIEPLKETLGRVLAEIS